MFKVELLVAYPVNLKQAKNMIVKSIRVYNYERSHCLLKYKTPDALHQAFLP